MIPFSYYKIDNLFSKKDCLNILNLIKSNKIEAEDCPADTIKTSNVDIVYWKNIKNELNNVYSLVQDLNNKYFGYNLYPLNNLSTLNLNTYDSSNQGEYQWHSDGSNNSISDIKLTMILNLSIEPYEGGEFEFFLNGIYNKEILLKDCGSFLLFKSYIPHRVKQVKKGKRHTVSIWFSGPKFI